MPKWFTRRERPQSMTAALSRMDRRALARRGHAPLRWQDEIDIYDDNGPGIVGNYLDLVEDKVRDAGLRIEYLAADGLWQPLPDGPILNLGLGVLSTYENEGQGPADLVAAHARLSASMGEAYGLSIPGPRGQAYHYVAHPRELQDWQNLGGNTLGSVVWENPSTGVKRRITFPSSQIWRSWVPRKSDPQFPTSELKRALPHIREYVVLLKRSSSDASSRLLMNDLVVFGENTEVYEPEDGDDPLDGMPEVIRDFLEMANLEDHTRYHDQSPVNGKVPFPMIGEPPQKVDIGRPLDKSLPQVEELFIGRIATSLRIPKKYLLEGPGNSKFDNEAYLTNALLDDCIDPIGSRVCADITRLWFRPTLAQVMARSGQPPTEWYAPHRLRLAVNVDRIRPSPDKTADMLRAWELGVVSPAAVTDVLDAEPLKHPSDMTDWDYWKATVGTGKGGEGGGPPAPLRAGDRIMTPGSGKDDGEPSVGPTASRVLEIAAAVSRPTEGNGDTKESQLEALLASLVALDQRLYSSIAAASTAELRRAYSEVGRAVSRALPARSPLRDRIRDIPDAEKWLALQDDGQAMANVNLDTITAGLFDGLRAQVQSELRGAIERTKDMLEAQQVRSQLSELGAEAGGALLVAALTGLLISRLRSGSDSDSVPDRTVVDTMLAAGGARVDGDQVVRDSVGTPLSRDGTADAPGTGLATGPGTTRSLRAAGVQLRWRWEHGLYRIPKDPHEPHLLLDQTVVASPGPIEGRYPGDHPWCSCGFVPVVVKP